MDTKINDGGTAFPRMDVTERNVVIPVDGMSLRDYFAAKAMQGILSCPTGDSILSEDVATQAYGIADYMIKERDKTI